MKKKIIFLLTMTTLILASCQQDFPGLEPVNYDDQSLENAMIPSDFSWETLTKIDVVIEGIPMTEQFLSTLYLKSTEGTTFYKGSYSLNQDLVKQIVVPNTLTELVLVYGQRIIRAHVENAKVKFSFVQKDTVDDYID